MSAKNKHWIKKSCESCGLKYNKLRKFKGENLCFKCYRKKAHIIGNNDSLDEALNKVRTVKGWKNGKNGRKGVMGIPTILIGRKVKLVLVE